MRKLFFILTIFFLLTLIGCTNNDKMNAVQTTTTDNSHENINLNNSIQYNEEDYVLLGEIGNYQLYQNKTLSQFDDNLEVFYSLQHETYGEVYSFDSVESHIYIVKNDNECIYLAQALQNHMISIEDIDGLIDYQVYIINYSDHLDRDVDCSSSYVFCD